jgi:hypothetical protein
MTRPRAGDLLSISRFQATQKNNRGLIRPSDFWIRGLTLEHSLFGINWTHPLLSFSMLSDGRRAHDSSVYLGSIPSRLFLRQGGVDWE